MEMALSTITWICASLSFTQVWSLPMPCHLQGTFVQNARNILQHVGGHFPPECLQDNVFIAFPALAFATTSTPELSGNGAKAVYETLKNINSLFEADNLPTKWDQKKFEDFQNIIYTQVKQSKCMESVETGDYPARKAEVNTYFSNVASVLKEKNFSDCAWEVVRKEVLETLNLILTKNSNCLLWT